MDPTKIFRISFLVFQNEILQLLENRSRLLDLAIRWAICPFFHVTGLNAINQLLMAVTCQNKGGGVTNSAERGFIVGFSTNRSRPWCSLCHIVAACLLIFTDYCKGHIEFCQSFPKHKFYFITREYTWLFLA